MRKFGFKLFNTNIYNAPELVKECAEFASSAPDMFIELMVMPNSTESSDFRKIKEQIGDVEVRIHAPHDGVGFDAGNKELRKQNRKLLAPAQQAADFFQSKTIIVHAGCGHEPQNIEETIKQFQLFNDSRIIVENLPHMAYNHIPMHGSTAKDIAYIMNETGCGFCFDFSHAVCAAQTLNIDIDKQLKNFYALKPDVYHMCDGDISKADDMHAHFGAGNYPLRHFLNDFTDENAYITIETGKGLEMHSDLRIKDYEYLKSMQ